MRLAISTLIMLASLYAVADEAEVIDSQSGVNTVEVEVTADNDSQQSNKPTLDDKADNTEETADNSETLPIEQQAENEATRASDIDVVDVECQRIGSKLGSVSYMDCKKLNLQASNGATVNQATILYKEYPPLPTRKPLGKVLLVGGIHGDEYSSVSIVFKWLRTLDKHHSGLFHWRIVPVLNADGLLQKKSQRMNANGVDLNRNFPMPGWEAATKEYWVQKTSRDPRRYPGTAPLSEPESQWLVEEMNRFQPDVIVAIHAPHGIIDYDGPKNGPHKLGRLYLNLLGTYPGSLGNYAGIQRKLPVVTIELPYAGIMPSAADISHIWRDLVSWLRRNIPMQSPIAEEQKTQETDPS